MHESLPVKRTKSNKKGIQAKNIASYRRSLEKVTPKNFSRFLLECVTYNPDLARPEIDSRHVEAEVALWALYRFDVAVGA
jgi:hypothetical protein